MRIGPCPAPASERRFLGFWFVAFAASIALTLACSASMSRMREMPMPGGWSLSMMWMRMPGQSWPGTAVAFLGMWLAMMAAMMLPSLLPMLRRYRSAIAAAGGTPLGRLTVVVGAAYFAVWTVFGVAVFAAGAAVTSLELAFPTFARAVPFATGALVALAGAAQRMPWKARQLACCRDACRGETCADASSAWRYGVTLGTRCVRCCLALTIAMLAVGMMDVRVMALATAAVSAERLAPRGERVARASGVVLLVAGLGLLVRAAIA